MRIWVPRLKIIEAKDLIVAPRVGIAGRYKLTVRPRHHLASVRRESPWFNNLILDQGLDQIGAAFNGSNLNSCSVGTGTTAPAVGDTELEALLATTTTIQTTQSTTLSSSPYGIRRTLVYRFGTGAAEGNLTEVGVGNDPTRLFSRELIRDAMGNPTTFPVSSDEVLDVTYQLTHYPPLDDSVGSVTIVGSGEHDFIWRASDVDSSNSWNVSIQFSAPAYNNYRVEQIRSNSYTAYSGDIGPITERPSGTSGGTSGTTGFAAYTIGNFYRDVTRTLGLDEGNVGGIRSIEMSVGTSTAAQRWQIQFDPAIPKNNTQTLEMSYRVAWGRLPAS